MTPLTMSGSLLTCPWVWSVQSNFKLGAVVGLMAVSCPLKPVRALLPRKVGQSTLAACAGCLGNSTTPATSSTMASSRSNAANGVQQSLALGGTLPISLYPFPSGVALQCLDYGIFQCITHCG